MSDRIMCKELLEFEESVPVKPPDGSQDQQNNISTLFEIINKGTFNYLTEAERWHQIPFYNLSL